MWRAVHRNTELKYRIIFDLFWELTAQEVNNLINNLSSAFQNASFNTSHDYVWKKFFFLNFTTGDSKLWSQIIREIYDSEKKEEKKFWNPMAQCYQMPTELEFYEVSARK